VATTDDSRARIVQKAASDAAFRQALLADPKAALSKELGVPIPDSVTIVVVEDAADTVHLVLPPRQAGRELSETELQAVAGGGGCNWNGTWDGCTF
jgi:hypothetical protein